MLRWVWLGENHMHGWISLSVDQSNVYTKTHENAIFWKSTDLPNNEMCLNLLMLLLITVCKIKHQLMYTDIRWDSTQTFTHYNYSIGLPDSSKQILDLPIFKPSLYKTFLLCHNTSCYTIIFVFIDTSFIRYNKYYDF
jgi:hypothetical protein